MKTSRSAVAAMAAIIAVGSWVLVGGQTPSTQGPLPLEPLGGKGEAVFAAFEGWGPHKDGRQVFLIGYYNRNQDQVIDIPIGPNNNIEPGGPDLGQPTHFMTGRKYGVFSIDVPKDFGNKRYTWTLVANGQKTQVSFWTNPPYWIDFFKNTANENEPPVIYRTQGGPGLTGPPPMLRTVKDSLIATVGQPLELKLWVSDVPAHVEGAEAAQPPAAGRGAGADAAGRGGRGADTAAGRGGVAGRGAGGGGRGGGPPRGDVNIIWTKYRGPGDVKFSVDNQPLYNKRDPKLQMEAATTATFSAPGEYVIMATANDSSGPGGGGDQCCWSTTHYRVNVK